MEQQHAREFVPEPSSVILHAGDSICVRDVHCRGCQREISAEECPGTTRIVFPYRGAFVRHLGMRQAVADVNQVLFFNAGEAYRVSHPVNGGDRCVSIGLAESLLEELCGDLAHSTSGPLRMRIAQRSVEPGLHLEVSRLRLVDRDQPLELQGRTLAVVATALAGCRPLPRVTPAARRLIRRAKLLLHAAPARRWSLVDLARELAASPVYLTQLFTRVEGMPLYRYQTRLRLARAMSALSEATDLATLATDHGFSSHSQLTFAFRRVYGVAPSILRTQFRRGRAPLDFRIARSPRLS